MLQQLLRGGICIRDAAIGGSGRLLALSRRRRQWRRGGRRRRPALGAGLAAVRRLVCAGGRARGRHRQGDVASLQLLLPAAAAAAAPGRRLGLRRGAVAIHRRSGGKGWASDGGIDRRSTARSEHSDALVVLRHPRLLRLLCLQHQPGAAAVPTTAPSARRRRPLARRTAALSAALLPLGRALPCLGLGGWALWQLVGAAQVGQLPLRRLFHHVFVPALFWCSGEREAGFQSNGKEWGMGVPTVACSKQRWRESRLPHAAGALVADSRAVVRPCRGACRGARWQGGTACCGACWLGGAACISARRLGGRCGPPRWPPAAGRGGQPERGLGPAGSLRSTCMQRPRGRCVGGAGGVGQRWPPPRSGAGWLPSSHPLSLLLAWWPAAALMLKEGAPGGLGDEWGARHAAGLSHQETQPPAEDAGFGNRLSQGRQERRKVVA